MKNKIVIFFNLAVMFNCRSVDILSGGNRKALQYIKNNVKLPSNPIIIDAGACLGTESIFISELWSKATIYSFEPVPELYSKLVKNTRHRKNIKTINLALSDKEGEATFYLSNLPNKKEVSQSSSLLKPKDHLKYSNVQFRKSIKVNTTTIDSWAKKNNIDHIDFLWLDLQGVELDVLKSSPNILSTVKAIYTEVEFVEAYLAQSLYVDIKGWLESNGFVLKAKTFKKPMVSHNGAKIWFGDALFVRKS